MATIQGVYLALFGRPADPAGLAFFNGVTNNGANLAGIGPLQSSKEYTDRFAGLNSNVIINSIYQSLFGRDAEAAGLNFFVDALNKGTLTINNIAIAILDGAQGNDKTILGNKLTAADNWTKALDTAPEIGAYQGNAAAALGRTFIQGVTTTVPSTAATDTAVAAMVSAGAVGNTTIALTAGGTDVVNTTSTTSTLKSTDLNDTITAAAGTWAAGDKIDGGLGVDTINASVGAGAGFLIGTDELKNVELAFIKATGAGVVMDVVNAKELTQVWNDASGANDLAVNNVALTTTVGVKGAVTSNTSFGFANATGSSDAATLALNGASNTGTTTVANIETLTVSNTGTSSLAGGLVTAQLKAAVVTGSGDLTLNFGASAESINASAYTGKFTTNLTANDALKTYTGGTGSDVVTIDGAFTNNMTIDLGAGNDTISLTGGLATKSLAVTLGAGADTVVTTAANLANLADVTTNAKLLETLITIADFKAAEDGIKLKSATGAASDRQTVLAVDQTNAEAASDLLGATTIIANSTAINKFAVFSYKGDTYIFEQNGTVGLNAGAGGDGLIKLTGIAVADLTATNFLIN